MNHHLLQAEVGEWVSELGCKSKIYYQLLPTKYGKKLTWDSEWLSGRASDASDLDMLLRDEPGSVCQQLVEGLEAAEFSGGVLEAAEPAPLPSSFQESHAMLLHHVWTVVPGCSLKDTRKVPGNQTKNKHSSLSIEKKEVFLPANIRYVMDKAGSHF